MINNQNYTIFLQIQQFSHNYTLIKAFALHNSNILHVISNYMCIIS